MPGTPEIPPASMADDVLDGLLDRPKRISSRWLYDKTGSELFEQITDLPEYYPTRTEAAIFTRHIGEMARALGSGVVLIEYGAGALVKTRALLDALESPAAFVPIDISGAFLRAAARSLDADYPGLPVIPVVADFTRPVDLPDRPELDGPRVGFFPGSTIGNLTDGEIVAFLKGARRSLGPEGRFLLGIDLKKDPSVLIPAYDDGEGVTARFNLNLLVRFNRELGTDFDVSGFRHEARWAEGQNRIEMHLVARRAMKVRLGGHVIAFEADESILTEISRKFEMAELDRLIEDAGWRRTRTWTDERGWFAVVLLS